MIKLANVLNRGNFRVDTAERAAFAGLVRSLRGQSEALIYASPRAAYRAEMPREGYRYGKPVLFSLGIVEAVTRDDARVLVSGHWLDVGRLKFSAEG